MDVSHHSKEKELRPVVLLMAHGTSIHTPAAHHWNTCALTKDILPQVQYPQQT